MAAERGDVAAAEALATEAEQVLLPVGANPILASVQFARGRAAIAEQRFADAHEHMRRIFEPADVAHHLYVRAWAVADLVDAAVHGRGDLEETKPLVAEIEIVGGGYRVFLSSRAVELPRPLLAPDDQAESLFTSALGVELQHWPCYRGRALLAYGTWLRRQRRVSESRDPLRVAEETFAALGFVTLAERARQELRATGETARRRTPEAWAQLTPQELQIAQMAAAGLTNRAIGQKLYLSHRTVAYHRYRIFPKLGIAARSQLRDAISEKAIA